MTIKSEVQGVVQALFGAYAGGYLVELTAEATANGTGAVAARLASVQGIILGQDLSTNKAFVDTILANMGVSSTNAAYTAASKWANDELTAGASRADIVSAAVAFLSGIAAGTIVDSNYTAVATAFAAKVEAGVTYSETAAGAKVLSVTALQTAAGFKAPANLTDALASVGTADSALEAFLKGAGLDIDLDGKTNDTTEADIGTNLDNAITAAEAAGVNVAYDKAGDAAVNASLITLAKAEKGATLTAAQKTLADLQKYYATNTDLAQAITAYSRLTAAETAAGKTADAAALSLEEAAAVFDLREEEPTVDRTFALDADGLLDPTTGKVTVASDLDPGAGTDNDLIKWDTTAKAFVVNSLVKTAAIGKAATSPEAKFLAEANTLLAAFQADYNAQKALNAAATAQNASENALGAFDAAVAAFDIDNTTPETGLALGAAIVTATTAVTTAQTNITKLNDALADLDEALALAAKLKALKADISAAEKVVSDLGYTILDLADVAFTGKGDLLVVGEIDDDTVDASLASFNLQGTDLVYIGTGFTFNAGDVDADGNDSVLEAFLSEDALGNAQIVLEEVAFGSNASTQEVVTITLTGVNVDDLTIANGYVQMA